MSVDKQSCTKEQLEEFMKTAQRQMVVSHEQKEIESLKKRIDWLESVIKKMRALASIIADEGNY